MNKLAIIPILLLLFAGPWASAQDILTAEALFEDLSTTYGSINDYEADLTITSQGNETSIARGKVSYKSPFYLRIDFQEPNGQVLVTDGQKLIIYMPRLEAALVQDFKKKNQATIESMASRQGLSILQRNYGIAFLNSPAMVPLDDGSKEMVWKLKLTSRSISEGYRQIILSATKDHLIRRIEGTTIAYEKRTLDFTAIRINQNIPLKRFEYDSPAGASVIKDFLYEAEE